MGWIHLFRAAVHGALITGAEYDTTGEYSAATFRAEPGGAFAYNPHYSLPPVGACTTYTGRGNLLWLDPIPGSVTSGTNLDAGSILGVSARRQPLPKSLTAAISTLGWFQTGIFKFVSTLLLNPGSIPVQGNGGADVGRFQATVPIPATLNWTNRDQIAIPIDRTKPLTVSFSGVPSGHTVLVMGGYYSPGINATGMFTCAVSGSAASFTIPAYILQLVPPLWPHDNGKGTGVMAVGSTPLANPLTFSATGLDYGAAFLTLMSGTLVRYQ